MGDRVRRTIRMPLALSDELDAYLKRSSCPSANQFIIEAIAEKLSRSR
jgi:metal-responsive CopG/Arc/MetJ family transcriptional regulator